MSHEDVVWIHYPPNYRILNNTNEPIFTEYRSIQIPAVLFISVYQYEYFIKEEPECEMSLIQKVVNGWWCSHGCADLGAYPALEACDQNELRILDETPETRQYLTSMTKSGHLGAAAKVWVRSSQGLFCQHTGRVFNCKFLRFENANLSERNLVIAYKYLS
jgi:hypothetical protein